MESRKNNKLGLVEALIFPAIFVGIPIATAFALDDAAFLRDVQRRNNPACYQTYIRDNGNEEYNPNKDYYKPYESEVKSRIAGTIHRFSLLKP